MRRSRPAMGVASAAAATATALAALALLGAHACKRTADSTQKNFVAKTGDGYVNLVAWPAYDMAQAKAFVSFTSKARTHDELFAHARAARLDSLFTPEMCWYGKASEQRLPSSRIVEVYAGRQLELSTERSVSCPALMAAMRAKPELQALAARLDGKAREAGVDACVYLTFALTPRFGAMLLTRMRQRGLATPEEAVAVTGGAEGIPDPGPAGPGGPAPVVPGRSAP